jgi:gluconolactonase
MACLTGMFAVILAGCTANVDQRGNLWATGPGGVLIISPEGKHLGTLATGQAESNCAWGEDGYTLFIFSHKYLCRVRTKVKGPGF